MLAIFFLACKKAIIKSFELYTRVRDWVRTKYVLASNVNAGENRFVSKRITSDGILYEFIYDGKLVVIPAASGIEESIRVEEMALPGSNLYPSTSRNIGAILVATEGVELSVVGCFWRYGQYLITAKHVANAVSAGIADVYLANHFEGKRGVRRLDLNNVKKIDKEFFDIETNSFTRPFDVFAKQLPDKYWSALAIGNSSTKTRSGYNMTVSAVGFLDGMLVTSAGKTLDNSGVVELYHTASTNKGFSGSPLYSGGSVVGMHVCADCNKNVAIRVELIKYCLDRQDESNRTYNEEYERDFKYNGESHQFESWDDGEYAAYDRSGRVFYGFDERQKSRYAEFEDEEEERVYKKKVNNHRYRDEESKPTQGVITLSRETPVHCNKSPEPQAVVEKYLHDNAETLDRLGYDPTKYIWPEITPETEAISCVKHLQLYHSRVQTMTRPNESQIQRVVQLTVQLMDKNRYEAPFDYKSNKNIERIINSNLVDVKKSPGHPYQAQGLVTNGAVLKHYGDSFVEIVRNQWNDPFWLKVFLKSEPTKVAKIEKGMARNITGMPLHKMIKNQAVFENFRNAMMDNWMESPAKYCFSPLVPGHIKHLANVFGKDKVYASDKSNWDFNCFGYMFEIASDIICELACQPDGMSDEQFNEYIADVRGCIDEVNKNVRYRCTNGNVYQSEHDGIMKSGWLLTIDVNTISQIALDVLIKVRMGLTDKEILSCGKIVAGGDDVLQSFPDKFDTKKYLVTAEELGFKLSDFEVTKTFDGCEFFSNRFTKLDGVWTFKPERFSKHIEKLKTCKFEDLPQALASHMYNYAWDKKRFDFFVNMYKKLRKDHPNTFPVHLLKTAKQLQFKLMGCEVDLE